MPAAHHAPAVTCVGSVHWDTIAKSEKPLAAGRDQPGTVERRVGGVAFNVASALQALGHRTRLVGVVGSGSDGDALLGEIGKLGIETGGIVRSEQPDSDSYVAIEAGDRVIGAIADCRSLESAGPNLLLPLTSGPPAEAGAGERPAVVVDGNLPDRALALVAAGPVCDGAVISAVAASTGKIGRMLILRGRKDLTLYVNRMEAELLAGSCFATSAEAAKCLVQMGFERAVVTDGTGPAADVSGSRALEARPPQLAIARNLTGAGDRFAAAHISARLRRHDPARALSDACDFAAAYVAGTQELRPNV